MGTIKPVCKGQNGLFQVITGSGLPGSPAPEGPARPGLRAPWRRGPPRPWAWEACRTARSARTRRRPPARPRRRSRQKCPLPTQTTYQPVPVPDQPYHITNERAVGRAAESQLAMALFLRLPVLDVGSHDVLLRRLHRPVRGREMSALVDVRILRGEIVEQRDPVILPLRRTGTGDRATEILLGQALIRIA